MTTFGNSRAKSRKLFKIPFLKSHIQKASSLASILQIPIGRYFEITFSISKLKTYNLTTQNTNELEGAKCILNTFKFRF